MTVRPHIADGYAVLYADKGRLFVRDFHPDEISAEQATVAILPTDPVDVHACPDFFVVKAKRINVVR